MFNIFRQLRALCARRNTEPRSIFRGHVPGKKKRPGSWHHVAALLLLAAPVAAFPSPDEFMSDEVLKFEQHRAEIVEAAYYVVYGTSQGFDAEQCHESTNDRFSLSPAMIVNAVARRRMIDTLLNPPSEKGNMAPLVLDACY